MSHGSILALFFANAENHPERTAAMVKRGGAYQELSWAVLAERVRAVAAGLVDLGVQPGDRVAVISSTRLEWVVADLGILAAGAVTVAIFPTDLADDIQFILQDAGAVVVVVEDERQVDKLRSERSRLPGVRRVVQIDLPPNVPREPSSAATKGNETKGNETKGSETTGSPDDHAVRPGDPWIIPWTWLSEPRPGADEVLRARREGIGSDSVMTLVYTSGTTGSPKGVVLSHGAMLRLAEQIVAIDVVRSADVQLLFLPLAHAFARMLEIAWLATRHILAFAAGTDTVLDNLREVRPTLVAAVPRFYEKLYASAVERASRRGAVRRALFQEALGLSQKRAEEAARGRGLGLAKRLRFAALQPILREVGNELRAGFGGRIRMLGCGGAPLSRRVLFFFADAGLTIYEGYGLTETGAGASMNQPGKVRLGTVGQVLPEMECRIADDGEILLRGPNLMREYWQRPDDSTDALRGGWLHTGDLGDRDPDGYLTITGRKKDVIVTAGGESIPPQKLEAMLRSNELISQVVVHGDRRKFLTALVTLEPRAVRELCTEHGLGNGAHAEMSQKPEVKRAVEAVIRDVNAHLPPAETIKRFKILEHEFSQESGELTSTQEVKRDVIAARYASILDGFYDET